MKKNYSWEKNSNNKYNSKKSKNNYSKNNYTKNKYSKNKYSKNKYSKNKSKYNYTLNNDQKKKTFNVYKLIKNYNLDDSQLNYFTHFYDIKWGEFI